MLAFKARQPKNLLKMNNEKKAQNQHVSQHTSNEMLPAVLLGYVIMRNIKFKAGTPTVNGIEWREMESGFQIDYVKNRYCLKLMHELLGYLLSNDSYPGKTAFQHQYKNLLLPGKVL